MKTNTRCLECDRLLTKGIFNLSVEIFNHPLCAQHQAELIESGAGEQTIYLYLALRSRKLPVVIGYFDGNYPVDIAIPGKLHIEVDSHYHEDYRHSRVPTIIIPKSLFNNPHAFRKTVDQLVTACEPFISRSLFYHLAQTLSIVQMQ